MENLKNGLDHSHGLPGPGRSEDQVGRGAAFPSQNILHSKLLPRVESSVEPLQLVAVSFLQMFQKIILSHK